MAPSLNLPPASNGSDDSLASAKPKFSSGGIIYPPPDIRTTVDKTADFVARNGASFEAKIKASEKTNPKFGFLNEDDPYHPYYQQRIEAARRGEVTSTPPPASQSQTPGGYGESTDISKGKQREENRVPEEPEPYEFSAKLPNITAIDLDIIKLSALFTARKGRSFATALQAREGRSFQFEFLRPSHSLYGYFNRLVEQYQKVMDPPTELLQKVKIGAYGSPEASSSMHKNVTGSGCGGGRPVLLEQTRKRAEYEKWAREKRKKADEEEEKERAAFDEIDWQDFVVVGTIELTEADEHVDLPPPRSIRDIESMTMAQRKMASIIMETQGNVEEEVEELEMPSSRPAASSAQEPAAEQAGPSAVEEYKRSGGQAPIKIRKDYVPRGIIGKQQGAQITKCPVCGLDVPVDEMSEHVRFELLDPRYREQRKELDAKKAQQAALQAGADPTHFLKQLANSRADADGVDEEARAKREAEEKRLAKEKEKIVWDGRATSKNTAKELHQRNVGLDEQINQLHRKPQAPAPEFGPMIPGQAPPDAMVPRGPAAMGLPSRPLMPDGPALSAGVKRLADEHPSGQPPAQRHATGSPYAGSPYQGSPPDAYATPPPHHFSGGLIQKNYDGTLHPENLWMEHHPENVTIRVHLPNAPSASSKADGRVLDFELSPQHTIGNIRDWVHTSCLDGQVGASKIKIKIGGKPATLRQTIAHWNLVSGDDVMITIGK